MNPEMIRQLAEEISKQTAADNWEFYIALLALSFVGSTLGAFLTSYAKKRGEVTATKADAEEILRQLSETTRTAKSVELSISRRDWIDREKNSLKRSKIELLLKSAFDIADWARSATVDVVSKPDLIIPPGAFSEFEMLSKLYFPEIRNETENLRTICLQFHEYILEIHTSLIPMRDSNKTAEIAANPNVAKELADKRSAYLMGRAEELTSKASSVYWAAHKLGDAAHVLMERLTAND